MLWTLWMLWTLAGNPGGHPVSYQIIESGSRSPIRAPVAVAFQNADEWKMGYSYLHVQQIPTPEAPQISFDQQQVLLLGLGERPTSGYTVAVDQILRVGDTLQVWAHESCPSEDAMVLQVLTQPYILFSIPVTDAVPIRIRLKRCDGSETVLTVKEATRWMEELQR